jgi:hypothetical protein
VNLAKVGKRTFAVFTSIGFANAGADKLNAKNILIRYVQICGGQFHGDIFLYCYQLKKIKIAYTYYLHNICHL